MIPSEIGSRDKVNDIQVPLAEVGEGTFKSRAHSVGPPMDQIPGTPVPDLFANLYTLHCIRNAPHVMSKVFRMEGPMPDIIAKCKHYCEMMRFRFLRVEPFLVNLQEDLRKNVGLEGSNQF